MPGWEDCVTASRVETGGCGDEVGCADAREAAAGRDGDGSRCYRACIFTGGDRFTAVERRAKTPYAEGRIEEFSRPLTKTVENEIRVVRGVERNHRNTGAAHRADQAEREFLIGADIHEAERNRVSRN